MKKALIAAFAGSALLSVPVYAADLGVYESPVSTPMIYSQSAFSWSGLYAGVNGGYSWGTVDPTTPGNPDYDTDGWSAGGQVGYNVDMGGFVLGAETDIQWASIDGGQTVGLTSNSLETNYFGTVRARAGMAFDRFMPYVTGGLAYAGATANTSAGFGGSDEQFHTGWVAGAGVEYAATDNISVKAEYLYTDLGEKTYFAGGVGQVDNSLRFGTARVGVNFKF